MNLRKTFFYILVYAHLFKIVFFLSLFIFLPESLQIAKVANFFWIHQKAWI